MEERNTFIQRKPFPNPKLMSESNAHLNRSDVLGESTYSTCNAIMAKSRINTDLNATGPWSQDKLDRSPRTVVLTKACSTGSLEKTWMGKCR